MRSFRQRYSRADWTILALLLGLTLVVYMGVAQASFVPWDDDIEITQNPHIVGFTWANWIWMWTDTQTALRYTPLSWLVWTLLHSAFGLNAGAFHVEALGVHLLNTGLAFAVVRAVLVRSRWAPSAGALAVSTGLAAAMWALHPLRVEVVAWATQVRFAEATAFFLLSVWCYLHAAEDRRWAWGSGWFWAAGGASVVSVLFYPVGIGLPALLLALDVFPLRRLTPNGSTWRDWVRLACEKSVLMIVPIVVALISVAGRYAAGGIWTKPVALAEFGVGPRLMQACYVFIYYLWKPWDLWHCSPVYTTLVEFDPGSTVFVASLAAMVILTGLALWAWRRWPGFTVLWLAHLALMVPMGGYFEHPHYANDRYAYLQGLLGAMVVGTVGLWVARHWRGKMLRAAAAGAVAIVLVLAGLSSAQVSVWRNGESLFGHVLSELAGDPYSADIHWRLAGYYSDHLRLEEAVAQCNEALAIAPRQVQALDIKSTVLIELARQAQRRGDGDDRQLAICREAAVTLRQLSKVAPRTDVYERLGITCLRMGEFAEAESAFTKCVDAAPGRGDFRLRRAQVQYLRGNRMAARAGVDEAVRVDPGSGVQAAKVLIAWSESERNDRAPRP